MRINEIQNTSAGEMVGLWESILQDEDLRLLALRRWVELDSERAVEYANGYREEELVWRTWGRLDGESALKASLEVRPWISEYVLSSFGEENPARALELIDEYQIEARIAEDRDVLEGIMKGLARVDPREALEFAKVKGHAGIGREVAVQFSLESPMEMLEMALLEEDFSFGVSLDDLAGIAAEDNPEAVRLMADSVILEKWRKYDAEEAENWTKVLSPEDREKLGLD